MSKMAAVDTAARHQIAGDGKAVGYADLVNAGYSTDDQVERFLIGVSNRLKLDTPSYQFDWSSLGAAVIGSRSLLTVISLIDAKTKLSEAEKRPAAEPK